MLLNPAVLHRRNVVIESRKIRSVEKLRFLDVGDVVIAAHVVRA
jgi:hypothetical protein